MPFLKARYHKRRYPYEATISGQKRTTALHDSRHGRPALDAAADSSTVTYQGTLRQPTHIPIGNGDYAITFSLWDAETAGNSLWTESHAAVPVREGMFSVLLGSNTAFGTVFTANADVWMEVTVDTGGGP